MCQLHLVCQCRKWTRTPQPRCEDGSPAAPGRESPSPPPRLSGSPSSRHVGRPLRPWGASPPVRWDAPARSVARRRLSPSTCGPVCGPWPQRHRPRPPPGPPRLGGPHGVPGGLQRFVSLDVPCPPGRNGRSPLVCRPLPHLRWVRSWPAARPRRRRLRSRLRRVQDGIPRIPHSHRTSSPLSQRRLAAPGRHRQTTSVGIDNHTDTKKDPPIPEASRPRLRPDDPQAVSSRPPLSGGPSSRAVPATKKWAVASTHPHPFRPQWPAFGRPCVRNPALFLSARPVLAAFGCSHVQEASMCSAAQPRLTRRLTPRCSRARRSRRPGSRHRRRRRSVPLGSRRHRPGLHPLRSHSALDIRLAHATIPPSLREGACPMLPPERLKRSGCLGALFFRPKSKNPPKPRRRIPPNAYKYVSRG